jgi:hypothetical protein
MSKAETDAARQARELSRMRQRLDDWRRGHGRGVVFPQKLWSSAGWLTAEHADYVTGRLLRLEYNKLKRASAGMVGRSGGVAAKRSMTTPIKFIELRGALPVIPGGCRLSLRGPDASGCRWRWQGAQRPRWCCSCAARVGVRHDPTYGADAHSGGGGEYPLSRWDRWSGADLPGATGGESFLRLAGGVLQSAAHRCEDFDV